MSYHNKILLDTNLLIYAINSSSPQQKNAQRFIQKEQENLIVCHQNITESLRILTHPKFSNPMTTQKAVEALSAITSTLTIISPTNESYVFFEQLVKKYSYKADKIFDLYLLSVMLSQSIETIATDNEKDFLPIKEIHVINPCSDNH